MKGVIIENDREKESLTEFTNDEVSAYNDAHPETGLTAGNGRVPFIVVDTIPVIRSFVESNNSTKGYSCFYVWNY